MRPDAGRLPAILALTPLLLLAVPATGQEEPQAEFGERLEVVEVFLDVLATDRRGEVVTGLGAGDFVVEADGEPLEITGVTFYTTRYEDLELQGTPPHASEGEAGTTPTTGPAPASRYFILFFHDQTGGVSNQAELTRKQLEAARDAHAWVRDEMGPSDWIAVVRFDQRLDLHCDFTQHQGTIMAAIEDATLNRQSEAMRPSTRRRLAAGGGPSLLRGLPSSFDLDDDAVRVYDAITLVAEAVRPIVGRKSLVVFTLGFGMIESAFASPDQRYYPPMEEALNAANVAVYPIDLNGSGGRTSQSNFLSQMADDTGGEYHATFLRFLDPLRRISEANTGYYLLSVRAEHPAGERGYREVEVKAKDRKIRVKARRGYRYGGGSSR